MQRMWKFVFWSVSSAEHIKSAHKQIKHLCEICQKGFTDVTVLRYHIKIQHEKIGRKHKCEICGQAFIERCVLKSHIRFVHSTAADEYRCNICDKVYKHYVTFREHEKSKLHKIN